ncbi:MAG TPA: S8 family serine peptidase [Polyangiaceae bacterium]|nr:S8 family serine peptidase [Polyangiaceae bacterium]
MVSLVAIALGLGASGASGAPTAPASYVAPGRWPALLAAGGRRPAVASPGSGRVPVTFRLAPGESAAGLGAVELAPGLAARRVPYDELGAFVAANAGRRPWVSPPLRPLLDRSGTHWTRANEAHAQGASGRGVVVAVIDTGLDFGHPDFLDASGKTRVAWMLDFGREPLGLHPELEASFGCAGQPEGEGCAVLDAADIERELARADAPSGDEVGHGSHVTSIAAGNGGPMARYVGIAPEATIIAVRAQRRGPGGGIDDASVIGGARFVFERAAELGMPAVVNVSLGGDFGPHDGSSPLEQGLASLVGEGRPGRAIVVAAGNSGGLCVPDDGRVLGGHTEARVLEGATTRLPIEVEGVDPESPVDGALYVWVTFQPGDEVSVGIEKNGQTLLAPVPPGREASVDDPKGRQRGEEGISAAVINGHSDDAPEVREGTNGAIVVVDGAWVGSDAFAVTLTGRGTARAWLQGAGGAETAGCSGALFPRAVKEGTINIPASHPDLLAVGCTLNRSDWRTAAGQEVGISRLGAVEDPPGDTTCYFSSAGPNALGAPKPEISAPGAFVAAAMGASARPSTNPGSMFASPSGSCPNGDECLVVDEGHAIASGTSMSSPHVTGAVALLLERRPDLTEPEIIALLQAGARSFEGVVSYDFQAGPGALSVTGALAALEERDHPRGLAPDPARSWVHLSTGLARPDGRSPVVVTVQARAADGSAAHGFPGALELRAEGAVVLAPLAPRAPGLWQATLAAPPGLGGGVLRVAAAYEGAQLGAEKSLPVEVDAWAAQGAARARGGCAAAAVPPPPRAARAAGALAGLAALALTRRRGRACRRAARRATRRAGRASPGPRRPR